MNRKPIHSFEFSCSIIVAFFTLMVGMTTMCFACAAHRVGSGVIDTLHSCAEPPQTHRPAAAPPTHPDRGIPVALTEGDAR